MQAELLTLLMAWIIPDMPMYHLSWLPQTSKYWAGNRFQFFARAESHQNFQKLAIITDIASGDQLRKHEVKVKPIYCINLNKDTVQISDLSSNFPGFDFSFGSPIKELVDNLDTQ